MKKNVLKRNVVVSAMLTIVLCVSIIAGATYALFTSESKVDVAITSGKVDVVASVDEGSIYTKALKTEYEQGLNHMFGGLVSFKEDGTVTLNNVVPGDAVKFTIVVKNNSSISVKYRTIIVCEENNGLFEALKVTINGTPYDGTTKVTDYETLAVDSGDQEITVEIELPEGTGNDYQEKQVKLVYRVEAVQGNAETEPVDENTIYIYNENDLANLATLAKEWGVQTVKKIEFLNDIDMTNVAYTTPTNGDSNRTDLYVNTLTVKGNGHYIKGLSNPLFNVYGTTLIINDLTIKDSTMEKLENNTLGYGAFVAGAEWSKLIMTNCHAENVKLNAGDTRAAVLAGYLVGEAHISNCSVNNCSVTAKGSTAGIIGHTLDCSQQNWVGQYVEDCEVKNSQFTTIDTDWRLGTMIGTVSGTTYISNVTSENNTLTQEGETNPNHELFGRIRTGGVLEIDGTAYVYAADLAKVLASSNNVTLEKDYVILDAWTPVKVSTSSVYQQIADSFTIDGQNHTISGLTQPLLAYDAARYVTIKNLTIKDSNINTTGNTGNNYHAGAFSCGGDNFMKGFTMNNCHAKNVTITGADGSASSAGVLVGHLYTHNSDGLNANIEFNNCTVSDSKVTNEYGNAAGLVGMLATGTTNDSYKLINCKVQNTTCTGENTEKTGSLIGTVNNDGVLYIENCEYSGEKPYGRVVGDTTTIYVDNVKIN